MILFYAKQRQRAGKGHSQTNRWFMYGNFLCCNLLTNIVLRPNGNHSNRALSSRLAQILQYYIHRHILHAPRSRIARWHRNWQLSIRAPYSFVANYDHPVAWLLHRWLPVYLPAVIFRFHILTFQLLLALVSLEELLVYSGYSVLPSTIILSGMARRADAHLLTGGQGNYAPWGLLDWVHGTTIGGDVVEDMRDELEKHHVPEKTSKALDSANGAVDNLGSRIKNRRSKGKGK